MLNLTRDLANAQGINKDYRYEAVVVNNDDTKTEWPHTCRIQARVPYLFDGVPDEHLPWATACFDHFDGASSKSGSAWVPKIGTKVFLQFQEGKPSLPIWSGFNVDNTTIMAEMKHNYPNRIVKHRLKNGAITLYDTKTNELFVRNPGTMKIYVAGDVELTVMGNSTEVVKGNRTISVEGNYSLDVKGSKTERVGGSSNESVTGAASFATGSSWNHSTAGASSIQVGGRQTNNAAFMADQEGGPSPAAPEAVAASPDLTNWPGFPGGAKGE